uniref:AMPKBI domain-containing protein n=1 Tax=Rhabditophanes sp. KR3021 TaxID=114890 RepID=A0AC35TG74_9BILA
MGNNQTSAKRERVSSDGSHRPWSNSQGGRSTNMKYEDECPVQVKISKNDLNSSTPSIQFSENNEYPVVFKWQGGTTNHKNVYISGSWDQWKRKIPMVKSTQDFSTIINLHPGNYEYKYLVDGKWVVDDKVKKVINTMGSENNHVSIDEGDFEVFDALDKDWASSNAGEAMKRIANDPAPPKQLSHDTPNDRELEKLKEFTQIVPDRSTFQNPSCLPPVLPPHLLQVILNKDTPVQCDPNVLPEPHHVMLNHLYALSIKDGVMVLSATHRYRKKYVTTLLYKPI